MTGIVGWPRHGLRTIPCDADWHHQKPEELLRRKSLRAVRVSRPCVYDVVVQRYPNPFSLTDTSHRTTADRGNAGRGEFYSVGDTFVAAIFSRAGAIT